jgi:hypothetical protein
MKPAIAVAARELPDWLKAMLEKEGVEACAVEDALARYCR